LLLELPIVLLEENFLKVVDGVLHIHSDTVLEAVNEVGLKVCHSPIVRGAIVRRALRSQQLSHIAPLLRLSVHIAHVMEQSLFPSDNFILHLLLDLSGQSQSIVLKLVSVEFHESLPKDSHGPLRHLKLLFVHKYVEFLSIFWELSLSCIDVKSNDLIIFSHVKLLLHLFCHHDLRQCVTFVLHQIVYEPIVEVLSQLFGLGGLDAGFPSVPGSVELDVLSELLK